MKTSIKHHLSTLAVALALFSAPALKAQFKFHVDINTTALTGAPNSPFFLDFQLNEGSGILSNTVTLSNFSFNSGGATGGASLFGNVTGSLLGTITLTDSTASPFNEFFQGFTPGTTGIHFDATISQHAGGAIPDGFFASILDSEPGFPQIGTTAPDGVSLISLNLGAANLPRDLGVYSSTSPAGVTVSALVGVPESSTYALAATALLAGVIALHRRKAFLR